MPPNHCSPQNDMTLIEMIWWIIWIAIGSGIGWVAVRVIGHGDPVTGAIWGGIVGFVFSFFVVQLISRLKRWSQKGK
jgi:hypothetical protein